VSHSTTNHTLIRYPAAASRLILHPLSEQKYTEGNPSSRFYATGGVSDPDPHHIWIRIRIRITVKDRIRIRIKAMRIRNTGHRYGKGPGSFSASRDKNQYTHAGWNPSKNLLYTVYHSLFIRCCTFRSSKTNYCLLIWHCILLRVPHKIRISIVLTRSNIFNNEEN
jgi:hypothetical protein